MRTSIRLAALALACAPVLLATQAQAADIVNTQPPTGGLIGSNVVDATDWIAESFAFASPQAIDGVHAFVLSSDSTNDLGKTFTLAVYRGTANGIPALNWSAPNQGRLFQTTVAYNGDGWTGATGLNWSLVPGRYWFAIEADRNGPGALQVPTGVPHQADAVAYYSGGAAYSGAGVTKADSFGLQVTSVPEPTGWLLAGAGLAVLGGVKRRRV